MKFWQFLLAIGIGFILIKCAQPRPVTGGDKDITSPKIVSSSPKNLSTNYTGQSLAFEFDEYVVIKSLNSELIVSPPLNYPVTYKVKGKRVFIELQGVLEPNTTYNFNFGNAIVDLNENNPLDSNLFVFSTGDILDSGSISGVVKDAYTLNPVKNATVMLFNTAVDSAIYHGDPAYIAKTDASGAYELKYLSNKNYQIFVLENPGSEFNYLPLTKIGFQPGNVSPTTEEPINFFLFQEPDTLQYVSKDFSRKYYSFVIGFNSDLIQPQFSFIPNKDSVTYLVEEIKADSFKFWVKGDLDLDSVHVFISDQTGYLDTVSLDLKDRTKFYKKLKKKDKSTHPLNIALNTSGNSHDYFDTLRLNFSRPPEKWDVKQMSFIEGSDTITMESALKSGIIKMKFPLDQSGVTKSVRTSIIHHKWEPNKKYGFIFYPGAFTDIVNQTNDTTILKFNTKAFEDYGSFRFTVNVPNYDRPLILELLNEKGVFLKSYKIKSGSVIYHKLAKTGKYKIRLILDDNGNNKWDTGDLEKLIQPETIVYYDGIIEIRPNWDMEEVWNVELK